MGRVRHAARRRTPADAGSVPSLADLRGVPDDPEWAPGTERPGDRVLADVLTRLKFGERLRQHEIQRSWAAVVGEFNASHSHPDSLRRGVLLIRVSNAALRHQLELLKPQLLARLQSVLGAGVVTQVRFGL